MTNPDPTKITNEMWRLWTERPNKAWKLGGFYADKKGYHNTVLRNLQRWPDNYSIKLPLDLVKFNRDKARAFDFTMSESEMIKTTKRMKLSAENPADPRLNALKEFYGTINGSTVFGLTKNDEDGPWRSSTADSTHLWHIHGSIFTAFVANWSKLAPILSVMSGQSLSEWRADNVFLPKLNDSGEDVKYWQFVHNMVRKQVEPDSPLLVVDGDYGPTTDKAFKDFWKKTGGTGTPPSYISGWLAMRYHRALAIVSVPNISVPPPPPPPPVFSEEQVKAAVNDWLAQRVPTDLTINGEIKGKVIL